MVFAAHPVIIVNFLQIQLRAPKSPRFKLKQTMSKKESSSFFRILGIVIFTIIMIVNARAQLSFTDQAGGFGPFGGYVLSTLKQPLLAGIPSDKVAYHEGFEVGIKSELFRFRYLRGNLSASYIQLGAMEWAPSENTLNEVDVTIKAFKAALDPFLFKVGTDFIHGYAGGGVYGTFFFNQGITPDLYSTEYWNGQTELKKFDYGVNAVAGMHIWSFDVEFKAQYGLAELGQRFDNTQAKQKFFSITLAYLYVNQHVTVKSCKRKKGLRKVY